jgi:hypothetical protein
VKKDARALTRSAPLSERLPARDREAGRLSELFALLVGPSQRRTWRDQ